jgi:hypothetical protein
VVPFGVPSPVGPSYPTIAFRGAISRDVINDLRTSLQSEAFNAPGAERVAGEYQSRVKYFQPADNADAERLAKAVEAFFEKRRCPVSLRVEPATSASGASSPLEVWLSHSCQ